MARYRLRFQLQEVDLPPGVTLLGRSLECQVTIEDPLVSRQHARIVVNGEEAILEDLGSRNGVKVNGVPLRQPTALKDGDRIRIGTQEMVLSRVETTSPDRPTKATGVLRLCANCKLPYPREAPACPNCEATEQTDEDTLSGRHPGLGRESASWVVQLLIESLERALSLSRWADAERILTRASEQIDETFSRGGTVDPDQIAAVVSGALRLSLENDDGTWARWGVRVYRISRTLPPKPIRERLTALPPRVKEAAAPELAELLQVFRAQAPAGLVDDEAGLSDLAAILTDGAQVAPNLRAGAPIP